MVDNYDAKLCAEYVLSHYGISALDDSTFYAAIRVIIDLELDLSDYLSEDEIENLKLKGALSDSF